MDIDKMDIQKYLDLILIITLPLYFIIFALLKFGI
jgi:hypothetical protein